MHDAYARVAVLNDVLVGVVAAADKDSGGAAAFAIAVSTNKTNNTTVRIGPCRSHLPLQAIYS